MDSARRTSWGAKLRLVQRRECWRLTWRGWLLFAMLCAAFVWGASRSIFPFLAVHQPVASEILVVEGWIPDYGIPALKKEFARGGYRILAVTGTPILKGEPFAEHKTYAELTEAILERSGFDPERVVAVPTQEYLRDRTYFSGVALRDWMEKQNLSLPSINIYSRGAHARRTRLLFEKAFEGRLRVGIIASEDQRYDGRRWWKTSDGVRDIIDESVAYLYARFLFRPALRPSEK